MHPLLKRIVWYAVLVAVILAAIVFVGTLAPAGFPQDVSVSIPKGTTLTEAADFLASNGLIRSATLFKIYTTLLDGANGVKTGDYLFTRSESAFEIAYRLVRGIQGFPVEKVTIPEGTDVAGIAAIVSKQIPDFDAKSFAALAEPEEGYLFPETYFWPTNISPQQVVADMRAQFARQIASAAADIAASGRSQSDIMKMAAILEREATSSEDRRIVAGILWKRLDARMPLQIDAPFGHILGKPSSELTADDLKTDSPYNLYIHAGLGPTPIANPGLSAIKDAADPTKTSYWYYLSDRHGVLHYASTLEGHAANKNKYL